MEYQGRDTRRPESLKKIVEYLKYLVELFTFRCYSMGVRNRGCVKYFHLIEYIRQGEKILIEAGTNSVEVDHAMAQMASGILPILFFE
jgi:hypothetical protein